MTIPNKTSELLSSIFQGFFGKGKANTSIVSSKKEIIAMSDEEYAAKAQKAHCDFNDMYAYNLMM